VAGGAGWATVLGYGEGWRVMGRRTGWWRTEARRGVSWRGRTLVAAGAALCAAAALPGQSSAADAHAVAAGTPNPYAFAQDAKTVKGAATTTDAERLEPGGTYKSALRGGGKLYYRLELDDAADAYVSATAVPGPGTTVSSADGLKVSVQDSDGHTCSAETTRFGPTQSPHPIAAWASREIGADEYMCQDAGTYYMVVERRGTTGTGSATGSSTGSSAGASSGSSAGSSPDEGGDPGGWGLELDFVSEPALKQTGSTRAPEAWDSASPEAVQGDATRRAGGTGFAAASAVSQGVWKDAIKPGQTLFYKVPVDWGQQLYATAEMGSATGGDDFVGTALTMSLYNPVRGYIDDAVSGYNGSQTSTALDPLPPVKYDNRYAFADRVSGMRFAGWYYLAVHVGAPVEEKFGDGPFGLTLRVRVSGTAQSGPAYAGRSAPQDVFQVTEEDQEEAARRAGGETADAATSGPSGSSSGSTGGSASGGGSSAARGGDAAGGDNATMRLVAVGGIGTGSVLVLTLGVWTLVARRRAGAGAGSVPAGGGAAAGSAGGAAAGSAPVGQGEYGPPRGR